MRNIRDAAGKLAQLRQKKVAVAIDDFGTGYSSLAYLQRLSLDTLKIDHSFVGTITGAARLPVGGDGESGHIVIGAIVALAKSLGLQVVAEGVETELQREYLVRIGCDRLQGYLFSPPKPADQIEAALTQSDWNASITAIPIGLNFFASRRSRSSSACNNSARFSAASARLRSALPCLEGYFFERAKRPTIGT